MSVKAPRGNRYAPARGTCLVMMMMSSQYDCLRMVLYEQCNHCL